ncbi:bifunctional diaminohydroxyphosphoribosylaminopyrimidine deaminase/5-amino-6-(5-phosphoribosylamino)uracil reductase RibD [Candidatus Uhrbacteria bacterium]|nr:bifunctional diaminohydroxyphosphoribosylaminopyrimidine deaminase/5-amino-6-(5-phosphoribosylamino)uracil reductase RibD [Candidatus Uhrbacteria bacterium]
MQLCLDEAMQGTGYVSPNPRVGSVILKEGRIIGKGYHAHAGGAHAEIGALRSCKVDPRGATLYVNLEPCCHFGKTPPCVDEIIKAGISRVVCGMEDPNPEVQGKGAKKLRARGIIVEQGILRKESQYLNRIFTHWITKKRPYIIAKAAVSADWKITKKRGTRMHITGPESQKKVHELRRLCDAILVGVDTVIADDPLLTDRYSDRPCGGEEHHDITLQPLRIILDSQLRIPLDAQVLKDQNLIIATTNDSPAEKKSELQKKGIPCISFPKTSGGVDLSCVHTYCANRQITSILVEGGAKVFDSFLQSNLINEWHIFQSDQIIGDHGVDVCSDISLIADPLAHQKGLPLGDDRYYYIHGRAWAH